jgi:hypothetical protein
MTGPAGQPRASQDAKVNSRPCANELTEVNHAARLAL